MLWILYRAPMNYVADWQRIDISEGNKNSIGSILTLKNKRVWSKVFLCRWFCGVMHCIHSMWGDGDCPQCNEDSPQPTVWSRRRASRGCSPHTGSTPRILLHLETEMKREAGNVSTQRKVKATHCPCEAHLIHTSCVDESPVAIPFHGIFFFFPFTQRGP